VEQYVEESKEAQHLPELDQVIPTRELAQRSYAQTRQQDDQRPGAGEASDILDRIDSKIIRKAIVKQLAQRKQTGEEDNEFDQSTHDNCLWLIAYGV
jgi:hypothetical protein